MGKIRTLLALSVVMFHCGYIFGLKLIGGSLAVQAFFIISGFYMSMVLNEKYVGANRSYKLFLSNRLLRLYPIYWVVLLITTGGGLLLAFKAGTLHIDKFEGYFALQGYVPSIVFMIVNEIILFGQDLVYSLGIDPSNGHLFFTSMAEKSNPPLTTLLMVPPAWTLGVELTFYLVAPFIVRRKPIIIFSLIVASFLLRVILLQTYGASVVEDWTYKFFPTSLFFFLCGYISYIIYLKIKDVKYNSQLGNIITVLLIAETVLYPYIPNTKIAVFPFGFADTLYYLSTIIAVPFLFKYYKSDTFDNKIGELSYPIYICHKLLFYILKSVHIDGPLMGLYVAISTIIFAILLTRLVTMPIERYRQSRIKNQKNISPLVS